MKILLVGCGHMGGAMLAGWLARRDITQIDIIDPSAEAPADDRASMHRAASDLPDQTKPDIAVLAVKPQTIDAVMDGLAPILSTDVPVLSIAAGVTLARLAKHLGTGRPLIRAMPNTPGAIGQGITAYIQNGKADDHQADICVSLLSTLGKTIPLSDESLMDAVTAVSGSGPAYLFALTEALEKAGIAAGLPPFLAAMLARDTMVGSASLMAAKPLESPENLRKAVTSPGGTTEAALKVLLENRALEDLLEEAVKQAAKRSRDLA